MRCINQSFVNDMEFQFLTVMDMFHSALVLHFDNQILQDKLVQQVEEFMVIACSFCYDFTSTCECSRGNRALRVRKETRYENRR